MSSFAGRVEARFTLPAGVAIAASNSGGSGTAVALTQGTYYLSDFVAHVQARLNAVRAPATWVVSLDTPTGRVSFTWTGSGTFGVAFTTVGVRDLLGFAADFAAIAAGTVVTGPSQALGLWIPNHPLNSDVDSKQAPTETDQRDVETPQGDVISLAGVDRIVHTNLTWEYVPINKVWKSEEVLANESYERFYGDAIRGNGNTWFGTGCPLRIFDHRGAQLGQARGNIPWKISGCPPLASLRMAISKFTGYTKVVWPRLLSMGF